jgi:uncharacterized membrane protein
LKTVFSILLFLLLNSFNVFIALVGISYLQRDFSRGYLLGKEALFQNGWFPTGLYWHSFTAPLAAIIISLLVLFRLERYRPLHRFLGKSALILVFFGVAPSGWILSYFAMGGIAGKLIFFTLASYTAYAAWQGYSSIRLRKISEHRHWMTELLMLLVSAIILRLLLTFFRMSLDFTGNTAYNVAAILSWVPSVLIIKYIHRKSLKT